MKVSAGRVPVMLIPRSAVIQKGDKTLAFVDTGNGTFQERDVTTGVDDAEDIEIKGGLKDGEVVVISGATSLLGTAMRAKKVVKRR